MGLGVPLRSSEKGVSLNSNYGSDSIVGESHGWQKEPCTQELGSEFSFGLGEEGRQHQDILRIRHACGWTLHQVCALSP